MFSGPGRKWIAWAWAIVLFAACGGSVVESNESGGAGGEAGADRGGAAGIPPVGGASGSVGRGGVSGAAGRGGFAGVSGGGMGGYAGSAGYGGGIAGAAGTCFDQGCAPGNQCCSPGSVCETFADDGRLRCYCGSRLWQCELLDIGDGTCPPGACRAGTACCRGRCVSLQNDPDNCGKCGNVCPERFCDFGVCNAIPCNVMPPAPDGGLLCCGNFYCGPGLTCCPLLSGALACYQPTPGQPACPQM